MRAGDRFREAGGIVDSRDTKQLSWDRPHLAPGDMFYPSWGWGSGMEGSAVGTPGLDKTPWNGSGPSWGQVSSQIDSAQHCQGWVHIWPVLAVSRHLSCGVPKMPYCLSVWYGVW